MIQTDMNRRYARIEAQLEGYNEIHNWMLHG